MDIIHDTNIFTKYPRKFTDYSLEICVYVYVSVIAGRVVSRHFEFSQT